MIRSVISLLLIVQFSTALVPQLRTFSRDSHLQAASSIGDDTILDIIAGNLANCLILSDVKRMTGNDGASTGWTSWVDEKSCFRLQKCIDKLVLVNPVGPTDPARIDLLEQRDEAQRWIRWMKNSPAPMIIEVSDEFRRLVDVNLDDTSLERVQSTRQEMLDRIGCRVIVMPSGKALTSPICTPAGAMAFGKLLYGGVTRYRMIGGGVNKRKAGERAEVYSSQTKSWLQYGGPIRTYEAVDMGPCALVEVLMLPKGLSVQSLDDEYGEEMAFTQLPWDPQTMFTFVSDVEPITSRINLANVDNGVPEELGLVPKVLCHDDAMRSSLQSKLGGLSSQVEAIVRRVLDGRVIRPASDEGGESFDESRTKDARAMLELGLQPVKGLLLYGPPGCGKTALAREISSRLDARPPKVVSAPELLDRWVGGSEKLVRSLFAEAELELKQCNGDATRSALHVIVIDEIDAVFRKRSSAEDSGEVTRASAVNQILSMLDGINSPGNILVIGMTNRRELLDEALLRPGRLEVQVHIPPPDQDGRREILQIHFEALRQKGRLSQPLCQAIDGIRKVDDAPDGSLWKRPFRVSSTPFSGNKIKDLAADKWTRGFSGADIAGLVRSSGSLALSRVRRNGEGLESLLVTVEDVLEALKEVKG